MINELKFITPILIDTGSPVSFIQNHTELQTYPVEPVKFGENYSHFDYKSETKVTLVFGKGIRFSLNLKIIQEIKPIVILGMDFLDSFIGYSITKNNIILDDKIILFRIKLSEEEIERLCQ